MDIESDPWMQALLSAGEMAVRVLNKTSHFTDPCKLLHWNSDEPVVILDLRAKQAFDKRHFHSAVQVNDVASWIAQHAASNKHNRILVICQDGKQSHLMVRKLMALGCDKASSLAGGFDLFTKIL